MSDESITVLIYAISVGWHNLLEISDIVENIDNMAERSKYYKMCEELADVIGLTMDELTSHF